MGLFQSCLITQSSDQSSDSVKDVSHSRSKEMIFVDFISGGILIILIGYLFRNLFHPSMHLNLPLRVETSQKYMYVMVISLAAIGGTFFWNFRHFTYSETKVFFEGYGVKFNKIARTVKEIERKTFHLMGLGVPILYQILTVYFNWSQSDYTKFCMFCTTLVWVGDIIRVYIPASCNFFPFSLLNKILREKERNQLSGTCYFSLGCTLAIAFFPPAVSTLSIVWLVLGDMFAALIGVSFGGETVALKLGREGNKSVEGSVAMFLCCSVLGMIGLGDTYLAEYAVIVGALVATFVELYEPFGLNDNITIPVMSSLALEVALERIQRTQNCQ